MNCFSQTKIWGAGAAQGAIDGEFQTNFIDTGVVGAYSDTAWTALSIYDSDTILPGNAYWTRSLLGYSVGGYSGFIPLPSPSQANGVALFDSDFMDNAGIPSAWGIGMAPSSHRGELISPLIDLSGYMDTAIMVRFFSEYRASSLAELSVSMSVDSGQTWAVAQDYRLMQDTSSPDWIRVFFPNITASVSNLGNCRLRFSFEGGDYYAMIDDVSIEVAPDYDIAIARPNPNSSILAERGDYVKIGNNRYVACFNLLAYDIDQWLFGLRAVNHGVKDLLPSDSARIMLEIRYDDHFIGVSPPIYLDTIWFDSDTLQGGGLNSHFKTDNIKNINFIFIYGAGDYIAKYWVEHKHADAFSDNDTVTHRFMNTEYVPLYNYTSKARLDPVDEKVQATSAFFPTADSIIGSEYGAMFYFPRGFLDNIRIDSIDFRYYVPEGYVGDSMVLLFVNIYRFIDGGWSTALVDGNLDSSWNELRYHGIILDTLTGVGTSHLPGTYGLETINGSSFIDVATGGSMLPFSDNGYYIVSIEQNTYYLGAGQSLIDSATSIWMGMDDYNYAMNRALTSPSNVISHSSVYSTMDTLGQKTWSWEVDGLNKIPSIGIHIGGAQIAHGTKGFQEKSIQMSIHPNPSSDILNIKASLEEPTDVQYIITDATGRVVRLLFSKNVSEAIQTINVKKLPVGVYYITIKTLQGERTEPFVKK